MSPEDSGRSLLAEQIEYYRQRAPEYDAMISGSDRFTEQDEAFAEILRRLDGLSPLGRVLELAAGTGLWTRLLASRAAHLTAVDAAPEMIERNRRNVADESVRYVVADVFDWEPDGPFDLVFFGFWLSHVPPERLDDFWSRVERGLAPGGRFFCVDTLWDADAVHATSPEVTRRLEDGREFRVVKVLYQPADLETYLRGRGWEVEAAPLDDEFHYATGHRSA